MFENEKGCQDIIASDADVAVQSVQKQEITHGILLPAQEAHFGGCRLLSYLMEEDMPAWQRTMGDSTHS